MIKRLEKHDPNSCFNKAAEDEPLFVLRAKDPVAAAVVRHWATLSMGIHEIDKLASARSLANRMEEWRKEHVTSST